MAKLKKLYFEITMTTNLKQKPLLRFAPHYVWETVAPDEVFLISEERKKILKGLLFFQIATALKNGPLSEDELVEKLRDSLPLEKIYYGIYELQNRGYFVEQCSLEEENISAYCHYLETSLSEATMRLAKVSYQIYSLCDQPIDCLIQSLKRLGISNQATEKSNLFIIIVDDYLDERIAPIAEKCAREKLACILFKPTGKKAWLGPLFTPENKNCFSCLSYWMKWNHLEETFIKKKNSTPEKIFIPKATLPTTFTLAIETFSLELFKWIVKGTSPLEENLLTTDTVKLEIEQHRLLQWGHCPSCCSLGEESLLPLKLTSQRKKEHRDGGAHTISPEKTVQKLEHLISPITGIIPHLEGYTQGDLYAYRSSHHNITLFDKMQSLGIQHFRQVSGGKGKTDGQAKASALCESLERYSGLFQGSERRIASSYQTIKEEAIDPRTCMLFSDEQYDKRTEWNETCCNFHLIPERFDESEKIEWSPLWSFTEKRYKYLPTSYCYYGYPSEKKPCFADSNGCAAGNTFEEAILQGFFELVERDCIAMWWYNQLQMTEVDLDSVNDPYLQLMRKEYSSMGRELWALDITNDLNIPTFVACSRKVNSEKEAICFGFGTNFDPEIALFRALTEMNQMILLDQNVDKNVIRADNRYDAWRTWLDEGTLENQPQFVPNTSLKKRCLSDFPKMETGDFKEDILLCQKIVQDKGMEMLVLDQTRPETGLSVARVVVPGLRHFWPRFAPGRLYNVPVKMDWLNEEKRENQFNPIPIMI